MKDHVHQLKMILKEGRNKLSCKRNYMLLAKVKTERKDIMDQIQELKISLESNPNYSNTMIAVSRGMSERNSAVGLEYEISNFDWIKDILYKTFQNKIVFIKNNPWVKIMSTNILDKNITTSAKELPQSFGDMTYITLRNPKKKHTIQIHEHRDPNDHSNQIKLCKRYHASDFTDNWNCIIHV